MFYSKLAHKIKATLRLVTVPMIALMLSTPSLYAHSENIAAANNIPFWQVSLGYWLTENTYLDGDLEYKIKKYNTIVHVYTDDDNVITEELKFYPPGHFFGKAIGLDIPDNKGVLLNQKSIANLVDIKGKAKIAPMNSQSSNVTTLITPFTDDSALQTITYNGSKTDSYRMLISHPTSDTRIVVNLGIEPPSDKFPQGGLRGASIFNGKRITEKELTQTKQKLLDKYNVGFAVSIDKSGKYVSEKI